MTNEVNLAKIKNFLQLIEASCKENKLSALSQLAIAAGLRDILDPKTGERYIVSPFDLNKYYTKMSPDQSLKIPKSLGEIQVSGQTHYIFSIPLNTVTLEQIDSQNTADHTFTINIPSLIESFKNKAPNLNSEVFSNYQDHWAVDVEESQLIPVFPLMPNNVRTE